MGNQWNMGFHVIFITMFLITTIHTCLSAENTTGCFEQERLALLKFKQSVKDEFGMLSSWVEHDCCQWEGIRCDVATGRVVGLRLRGYNIWNSYYFPESNPADEQFSDTKDYYHPVGEDYYLIDDEVDSSLTELRHLKYLDLSGNDFQKAVIPEFIGSLKQLSYLNLSNAGFSGTIPDHLGNLTNLEVLDLSSPIQDIMAEDMAWVFRLSVLKHLDLSGVDLRRSQDLDAILDLIPSLIKVSMSHCSLTNAHFGPRLNSSRTLLNIRYLDLSKNFFSDRLPAFVQNMTSLTFLDISNSDFSFEWKLTNLLNSIPSLSELHLSGCRLHNEHLSPTRLNFSTHSKIQHLDLSMNAFEGRFPSVFKNMTSLRVLDLHRNFLKSSVPVMPNLLKLDISSNNFKDIEHVGIWRQCHLKQLSVSRNDLKKEIIVTETNVSRCSQYALEVLHLDRNQLIGSIPTSLVRLSNLRVLDLSSNILKNPIPESLSRLKLLEVLDLSSNQLSGTIPISIGRLDKINFLNVSSNYLEGVVLEAHFSNLSKLNYLDISFNSKLTFNVSREWTPPFQLRTVQLSSCKIADEFPQWLRTQRNLKMLVLSNTGISGPLPTWLLKMPIIPHLDLSQNKLSGPLTNLPFGNRFNGLGDAYRGSLLLQDNLFNGSIPKSLCRRTALEVLDLSKNRLTGEIPICLENLQKLRRMIFSSNKLSGVIPSSIGRNSLLRWLHLNDNNFIGEIPQDLGNLHDLWVLDVGNNELSGKIPEWIGELTELMVLRLHENNFTGRIPPSLCKSSCLQILDVAHNSLKGLIPRCLGELPGMIEEYHCRHYIYSKERLIQVLKGATLEFKFFLPFLVNMDLSSNQLVGQIPEELTALSLLMGLNLSHNHLDGSIPGNTGNMERLVSLDFAENKLTGMIPPSMTDMLFLGFLNLSDNNLSGQIPTGYQFSTFDSSSYVGNEYLCGPPIPKNCSQTSKNFYHAGDDDPKKIWFYLDIICGFATGFLGTVGFLLFKKQWKAFLSRFSEIAKIWFYLDIICSFTTGVLGIVGFLLFKKR